MVGYSAEWEQREAARFVGLTWQEFEELDGEEQSDAVAHYRAHKQFDMAIQEASKLH